jgi:hypothetical protein
LKKPCELPEEFVDGTCVGTAFVEDVWLDAAVVSALLPTAWFDASTAAAQNTTALVITRRFFQDSTRARVAAFAATGFTAGSADFRPGGVGRTVASVIAWVSCDRQSLHMVRRR